MTVCTIILTVVSCVIDPATKVSAAEAVKLMTHPFVYVPPVDTREARVTIMPDSTRPSYVPPTYPLTPGSYTPVYPYPFYPPFFFADGFGLGSLSQNFMERGVREDHDAPPLRQPVAPSPPPGPTRTEAARPAASPNTGGLVLRRLTP